MIKCDYCQTYNKHGVSNCCACGAPIDYSNSLPKFIIKGGFDKLSVNWDTPGGCVISSTPWNCEDTIELINLNRPN